MKENTEDWFKRRGYIHFDSPISFKTAQKLVKNKKGIAKHSFFPFISYEIESIKVYKDSSDKIQEKEKKRPIAYASHVDSHIYAYYALQLEKLYEAALKTKFLNDNVLAFRSLGKSNIQFANHAFEDIKSRKICSAVALDIKGFFDNLDHHTLKSAWKNLLNDNELPKDHYNIFKSLTKFSQVDKISLYETLNIPLSNPKKGRYKLCDIKDFRKLVRGRKLIRTNFEKKGIPQGSPISALLSNIYMLDFDIWAKEVIEEKGGSYYRYCDDILFITHPEFKNEIENAAQHKIHELKLELNTNKTEVRDFWMINNIQTCSHSLQYLGFTFDGQRKLIRSAALARFSNRMKRGVKLAKATCKKTNKIRNRKNIEEKNLYKRKLYERYSHLGKRNFVTYGHRAANEMKSDAIRRQLKPLWNRLQKEMEP